ncbi:unnamed protein product [Adineta steineri]|uniref:Uncharacterized protein n=1 Tax=Adineta steineri TaxID=433720 RepID=A0A819QJ89_9BILA|nr:unnamed protein product [Adineta steineri]CAF4026328.1 unnamed protein product [Adineta steineri]
MNSKLMDADKPQLRFMDFEEPDSRMLVPIKGYSAMPLVSLEKAVEPLVSLVTEVQHMAYVAKKNAQYPKDGLSSDESAAIMLYTLEWTPRKASFYLILNATLRKENREALKPWFLYLRLVFTALSRLPSVTSTIYRAVKDVSTQHIEGEEFIWWNFASCTTKVGTLENEQYCGTAGNVHDQKSTSAIIEVKPKKTQIKPPAPVPVLAPSYTPVIASNEDTPRPYIIIATTVIGLIVLGISLMALITGVIEQSECAIQPWIPKWLIGFGVAGLVGAVALIVLGCVYRCCHGEDCATSCGVCLGLIFILFFLAWMIAVSAIAMFFTVYLNVVY